MKRVLLTTLLAAVAGLAVSERIEWVNSAIPNCVGDGTVVHLGWTVGNGQNIRLSLTSHTQEWPIFGNRPVAPLSFDWTASLPLGVGAGDYYLMLLQDTGDPFEPFQIAYPPLLVRYRASCSGLASNGSEQKYNGTAVGTASYSAPTPLYGTGQNCTVPGQPSARGARGPIASTMPMPYEGAAAGLKRFTLGQAAAGICVLLALIAQNYDLVN